MLDSTFRFVKQVCRGHLRHPGFSLLVILTLALGIAATTAVFSTYYAFLLRSFPFTDSERLVMMTSAQPHRSAYRLSVSYPDFLDWKTQTEVVSEMAIISNSRALTLSGGDQPEHLTVEIVSGNYFPMLGLKAVVGRTFRPDDDVTPGGHPLVLLSFDLWSRRFGQNPEVVGTQILLNDHSYTVIGVLDSVYRGTWWDPIDLWVPAAMVTEVIGPAYLSDRTVRWGSVMARLRPGVTADQARDVLNRLSEQIEKDNPVSNKGYRVAVYSLHDLYYAFSASGLKQAFWGGVLLLFLCCANVAALMLIRGTMRRQELAVRSALGAGRKRLMMEELGQALMLALAGGALGVFLAALATRRLVNLSTLATMNTAEGLMDPVVLAAALGFTVVAGLVFGVAPALQVASMDPQRFLKPGAGTASPGGRLCWLLDGLAAGEVAMAVVLLVSAGGALQTFLELRGASVGYATDDLLTLRLDLSSPRLQDDSARERFALRLVEEVDAIPGVEGSGLVGPYAPPSAVLYTDVTIEDRLADSSEDAALRTYRQYISPGYLEVMDIGLLEGREFTEDDDGDAPLVAIVGKRLADRAWPSQSPIGKRLRRGLPDGNKPWMTVIGVAEAVTSRGPKDFGAGPGFDLYMPFLQHPAAVPTLMVRAASFAEASSLAEPVRRIVQNLDPEVPIYQVVTMRERLVDLARDEYFIGIMLLLFSCFATVISGVGLFGILSYGVRQRLQEFGVRMALGGSRGNLMGLVVKRGVLVLTAGLIMGCALVWALGKDLPGGSLELQSVSPLIFSSVLGFLVGVTLLAILLPALRAMRVEPSIALRGE